MGHLYIDIYESFRPESHKIILISQEHSLFQIPLKNSRISLMKKTKVFLLLIDISEVENAKIQCGHLLRP